MNTKQAVKVLIGAELDNNFMRAFQTADKQFAALSGDIAELRQQQKLLKKFEMNTSSVEKARERLDAANESVRRLRAEAQKNPTAKLKREFTAAHEKAERLRVSLERERVKLGEVRHAMKQAGVSTRNYTAENDRLSQSMDKLVQRQQKLANLQQRKAAIKQGFSDVRGQALGMAATGASAGFAVKPGYDFQKAVDTLRAKSSNMTEAQAAILENQARDMGRQMQFTASEVVQGQTFLSMAGFDANEIKAATPGMLNLSAASGMELGAAADISSNILSGFGMEPEEMGRVGDVLTKTFTSSNVTLEMLGQTMKYVAPVASKTGASMEEMAAMTGLLGNVGIQGSQAGTAMRAMLLRMAGPPKAAADALRELGVATKDSAGNMRGMPDILQDLHDSTKALGSGDRAALISKIFGVEASSAALELMAQAVKEEKGFADMLKSVEWTEEGSKGKAAEVARIMNDNVAGAMGRARSAIQDVGIALWKPFEKPLQYALDGFAGLLNKVSEFAIEYPAVMKAIAYGAGGLLAFGTASVVAKASLLAFKFIGVSTLSTIAKFSPLLQGAKLAIKGVTVAMRMMGVAMMANPVGAVLGGIALAATAIYMNWDRLMGWFETSFPRLHDLLEFGDFSVLTAPFTAAKTVVSDFVDGVKSKAAGLWGGLVQKTPFPYISAQIKNEGSVITGSLLGMVDFIDNNFAVGLRTGFEKAFGFDPFEPLMQGATDTILFFGDFKHNMQTVWCTVKSTVSNAWNDMTLTITTGIERWINILTGLHERFREIGGMIMSGLIGGIKSGVESVISTITETAASIKSKFTGLFDIHSPSRVFVEYGDFMMQGLGGGIRQSTPVAVQPFTALSRDIRSANDDLFANVGGKVRFEADPFKPLIPAVAGGLAATVLPLSLAASPIDPSAYQALDIAPARLAAAEIQPVRSAPVIHHNEQITIQVYQQPGEDSDALVQRIEQMLDQRTQRDDDLFDPGGY